MAELPSKPLSPRVPASLLVVDRRQLYLETKLLVGVAEPSGWTRSGDLQQIFHRAGRHGSGFEQYGDRLSVFRMDVAALESVQAGGVGPGGLVQRR